MSVLRREQGGVSLVALSSFGGVVLLIRVAMFPLPPQPLAELLASSHIVKIGISKWFLCKQKQNSTASPETAGRVKSG